MDLPTRADLFAIGAEEMIARGRLRPVGHRLSQEAIYLEGSDVNILTAGASAMADECIRQLCKRAAALYLDSAEGDELQRLVADRWTPELVLKGEQRAVVPLSFTRVSGGLPAVTLNTGTRVRTPLGIEFRTIASVSIPLGSSGPVSATAEAVEFGSSGNVDPNTITAFVQTPADSNLLVTNPERAAGGDEEETPARFRARARQFYTTARRGTLRAIQQGALAVGGVAQATVEDVLDDDGLPSGLVTVVIADIAGQANSVLINAVRLGLLEFRSAGIVPDIIGAVPVYEPITYRLRFTAGTDTTIAFQQVQLTTVAKISTLQPGQTLERALLQAVAKGVPGVIVLSDAIVAPVGDVVPLPNQVIRTRADLVTIVP